jgi:hypothetical protein
LSVDVIVSQVSGFFLVRVWEVQLDWRVARLFDPEFPVDSLQESVNKGLISRFQNLIVHEGHPGGIQLQVVDTWLRELIDVCLDELLHEGLSNEALQIIEELVAFLVRNVRERVIWGVPVQYWVQAWIWAGHTVVVDVSVERGIAQDGFAKQEILTVDFSTYMALFEGSETLIKPHVAPVLASKVVASPRVADLVSRHIHLWFVTYNNSGRGKGEKWVLHASVREAGREHEDGVVTPNVGRQVSFRFI